MLWVLVLGAILIWAPPPTITHRMTAQKAHIKPKPCSVNGIKGTCMFVYECIKTDGKHVGMCVDNFMFGSCCSHNVKQNSIIPHHHNYHHHHQPIPSAPYSSSNINSSPKPPNHILNGRPQSNKPVGFVTNPTKKPPSTSHHHWSKNPAVSSSPSSSSSLSSLTTTSQKQLGTGGSEKPWTNRPLAFVTSSDSSLKPSFPEVKFPTVGSAGVEVTQSLLILSNINKNNSSLEDNSTSTPSAYDVAATKKPAHTSSNVANQTIGAAATVSESSSATTMAFSTNVSSSSKDAVAAASSTLATTTSTYAKPSSSWSPTPKPSWHESSHINNIIPSPKPWSLLSKPENSISDKPNFITSQITWTSKPYFVTRPRPQSNLWLKPKPKPTRKPISHSGSLGISSIRSNLTNGDVNKGVPTTSSPPTTTPGTTFMTATTPSATSVTTWMTWQEKLVTTMITTTTAKATTADSLQTTTAFSKFSKYKYSGQCGVAALSPRPEMRIVGGKNAPFGGWPWQVSVRRTSFFGFSSTHRCGGAVINENWIATAGHCVDDLLTSQIRIRVGEYDFSSVQEPYPFVERGVSKKVVHPKYNFFTYEYDLALVRLESSLEFQPHISPICLPASDDLLIGENATVTGWGRLSEGGTLPSVLQQVSVPIVSNDKCKSMFLRAGRHEFIPEIFLCAGYENGGQDSCQGDSGGPLQVKGKNGRYFLAGIISWGIGCAEANLPGVCTRISKFVPWILENVT